MKREHFVKVVVTTLGTKTRSGQLFGEMDPLSATAARKARLLLQFLWIWSLI
jgi:hypothetical protein